MGLLEGGIIGELKKRKAQRDMDEYRDSFVAKLSQAGANKDALEMVSKIKAESPEKLASAIESIQKVFASTPSSQEEDLKRKILEKTAISKAVEAAKYDPEITEKKVEAKKRQKEIEAELKQKSEENKSSFSSENTSTGTFRFIQQYQRSFDELQSSYPEIGDEGYGGFISRKAADFETKLDQFPETKVLKVDAKVIAQEIASELEGGRVTEQDRKIQEDRFASAITFPTKANIRLMANSYIRLLDKGGDERGAISNQLKKLISTKSDIFNSVVEQILIEYPELSKKIFGDEFEVVQ